MTTEEQEQRPMRDINYYLLRQCIFDAEQIAMEAVPPHHMVHAAQSIMSLAIELYRNRTNKPIEFDELKRLMLGGYEAVNELEELKAIEEDKVEATQEYQASLDRLQEIEDNITRLKIEIDELREQQEDEIIQHKAFMATTRAEDFLATTIGSEYMHIFEEKGFIDVMGTNRCIYRIQRDGKIVKFKNTITGGWKPQWDGAIMMDGNLPMDDCVATLYAHIVSDADKFDQEKSCGNIIIETSNT